MTESQNKKLAKSFTQSGMTFVEVLIALAIAVIVFAGGIQILKTQIAQSNALSARFDAESLLYTTLSQIETELRSSLPGIYGFTYLSSSSFIINRALVSNPAQYQRIAYTVSCMPIASGSAFATANITQFKPPPDCQDVTCPANQRPQLIRQDFPNYSASTASTSKVLPDYDGIAKKGRGIRQSALAMTLCLRSPNAALDVLAGFAYAYYIDGTGTVKTVKRQFSFSKSQTPSNIQFLPAN